MREPNFVLLYVKSPEASAAFYGDLLDAKPVESSPTFAMFGLKSGVMLGLWARDAVLPRANAAGGAELGFPMDDDAHLERTHADWKRRGLAIEQEPTRMDFGYTFVALDPDGHRLRAFAAAGQ